MTKSPRCASVGAVMRTLRIACWLVLALVGPVVGAVLIHLAPSTASAAAGEESGDPDSGSDLIGRPAPEWAFTRWVRGPRMKLADLRGKVVLVRWWTDGCRYCRSTLPALEDLKRREGRSDFVVLGVYHPKPRPREVSDRRILEVAGELGFSGPVAFDRDWRTLGRYWLDGHDERSWTSVSFLIDREGIIRWVHGGGEYHPGDDPAHQRCADEFAGLETTLESLLGP